VGRRRVPYRTGRRCSCSSAKRRGSGADTSGWASVGPGTIFVSLSRYGYRLVGKARQGGVCRDWAALAADPLGWLYGGFGGRWLGHDEELLLS
jgi:hypothetical protein